MDALKFNMKFLGLCLFALSACSNGGSEIDAAAKKELLSNTVILGSVKQQCLPMSIVDEEDLPLITRQGYTLSPNNEYCLPPIDTDDGDDTVSNCIREIFVDDTDLAYLISIGYVPSANGDYCLVIGGGTSGGSTSGGSTTGSDNGGSTSGGSTTGGSTSAGSTSGSDNGGSTTGSDNGGSTSGGSTTGGSASAGSTSGSDSSGSTTGSDNGGATSGGSTTGGSTSAGSTSGSDNGGSTSGGSTTGGSTSSGSTSGSDNGGSSTGGNSGGMTSGGSTSGGSTSAGSTSGSDNGGSMSGGSTSGGSTSGGSTSGGSTSGGSTSGGECRGNNGHGNDRDGNDSSNPGHSSNGDGTDDDGRPGKCPPVDDCEMNLIPGLNKEASFAKCNPWNVPVDRVCSRIRTSSGRFKLEDRLELVLQVVKRVETVKEVEVCKTEVINWWKSSDDDDDSHAHKKDCKHENKKVVCKVEKQKVVTMIPICESRDTAKIKTDVIDKKRLDLSACDISGHKKSDLYVTLFSPVEGGDLPVTPKEFDIVRFFAKNSEKRGKDEISFIMYGSRDKRYAKITEKIQVITDDNPDFNSKVDKKKCDMKASPLIVHINPKHDVPRYVELSSIADGVQFNILGFNAEPRKNARHQISWLNTDQYMFLVKPNKKGRVEGVDQMFGDNTRGPDKDFAANGFLALAKFDANEDGLINSKDAVFKALRLWNDKNFDGVGTPDEMVTLDQMSVKNIDLNYDPGFYERDAYGNETIYKSVIQYQDGSLDLIFDLWFNYKK